MDSFFTKKQCDRCGSSLNSGRIMSMFNEDVICMECKDKETKHPKYEAATRADIEAIKSGNRNFKGIGFE